MSQRHDGRSSAVVLDLAAEAFVVVADTLAEPCDPRRPLDLLTAHAAQITGAAAVGVLVVVGPDAARQACASNELAEEAGLVQVLHGEGPCLDSLRSGRPVVDRDLDAGSCPWPLFAPRAVQSGLRSVHALPLRLRSDVIGAVALYGGTRGPFDADDVGVVQALADVATIAVLQQRVLARAEEVADQLQSALASRVVIEQAKGALAHADGISTSEAFDLLRSTARSTQRKMADVARDVLDELARDRRP